jgi:hypothetical protein
MRHPGPGHAAEIFGFPNLSTRVIHIVSNLHTCSSRPMAPIWPLWAAMLVSTPGHSPQLWITAGVGSCAHVDNRPRYAADKAGIQGLAPGKERRVQRCLGARRAASQILHSLVHSYAQQKATGAGPTAQRMRAGGRQISGAVPFAHNLSPCVDKLWVADCC